MTKPSETAMRAASQWVQRPHLQRELASIIDDAYAPLLEVIVYSGHGPGEDYVEGCVYCEAVCRATPKEN